MRKTALFISIVIIIVGYLGLQSFAADEIYGDYKGSATFSSIKSSLSNPYKSTEFITVATSSGMKKLYFNLEMFLDKGFLVYGDVYDVGNAGYVNSFKTVSTGYFTTGSSGLRGEYKYLGFSINGAPQTNKFYPDDMGTSITDFLIVPYSSLSDWYKDHFAVPDSGNSVFEGIRELIDCPDSPAYDFTKLGESQTLREFIEEHSEDPDNFSIFDNGLIYSWGSGLGSIRLFIDDPNDPGNYRYATFTGDISPLWQKNFINLNCKVVTESGVYRVVIPSNASSVTVNFLVKSSFTDNYASLSASDRKFTYTRDEVIAYGNEFDGNILNVSSVVNNSDTVDFVSQTVPVTFYRRDLTGSINLFLYKGISAVSFEGITFNASNQFLLQVDVENFVSPTATPKPSVTPTVKPSVTPSPTVKPTNTPTAKPTATATVKPTNAPTAKPTATPTVKPTNVPTATPTVKPTYVPTAMPTVKPTYTPTAKPTATATPSPTPESGKDIVVRRKW